MTLKTATERALIAYTRPADTPREVREQDARDLADYGVFSNVHIIEITKLPKNRVYELCPKSEFTGGRFNTEMLPFIHDLEVQWGTYGTLGNELGVILKGGVSASFLEKLTRIDRNKIRRWVRQHETQEES